MFGSAIVYLLADAHIMRFSQTLAEQSVESSMAQLRDLGHARTDASARREAVASFLAAVEPWTYEEMSGEVPLKCEEHTYTGPVEGVGSGADGVTVKMRRVGQDGTAGDTVLVKLWRDLAKAADKEENLSHECAVLRYLADQGVPNLVSCEASCEYQGRAMIVVSPFVPGALYFHGAIQVKAPASLWQRFLAFFGLAPTSSSAPHNSTAVSGSAPQNSTAVPSVDEVTAADPCALPPTPACSLSDPAAVDRASRATLETGYAMLAAGVANRDQNHNILYLPDGTTMFIDMGLATTFTAEALDGVQKHHAKETALPERWAKMYAEIFGEVLLGKVDAGAAEKFPPPDGTPMSDFLKRDLRLRIEGQSGADKCSPLCQEKERNGQLARAEKLPGAALLMAWRRQYGSACKGCPLPGVGE